MSGKNNRMEHPSLAEASEGFFVYGIINRTSCKGGCIKPGSGSIARK